MKYLIRSINDLPNLNDVFQAYYLSYRNDFLSMNGFAAYYNLNSVTTRYVIAEGRKIFKEENEKKFGSKITLEQKVISEMKRLKDEKVSIREISEKTKLSHTTIWRKLNQDSKVDIAFIQKLVNAGYIRI